MTAGKLEGSSGIATIDVCVVEWLVIWLCHSGISDRCRLYISPPLALRVLCKLCCEPAAAMAWIVLRGFNVRMAVLSSRKAWPMMAISKPGRKPTEGSYLS